MVKDIVIVMDDVYPVRNPNTRSIAIHSGPTLEDCTLVLFVDKPIYHPYKLISRRIQRKKPLVIRKGKRGF